MSENSEVQHAGAGGQKEPDQSEGSGGRAAGQRCDPGRARGSGVEPEAIPPAWKPEAVSLFVNPVAGGGWKGHSPRKYEQPES